MTKNAITKNVTLATWSDGSKRSYSEPIGPQGPGAQGPQGPIPPPPSNTIVVAVTPISGTENRLALTATPEAGRTVVQYQIERSTDGSTNWTAVATPDPVAPSEIPPQDTRTPTIRVSPTGTLGGLSAYTTIQAAFDVANPGDVIAIGPGTYTQRAIIRRSGTATSRIYIRPWDYNNRPVLDGQYSNTITPGWVDPYAAGQCSLLSVMANYVTVDGINIRNSYQHGIILGDAANNASFTSSPTVFYFGIKLIRCDVRGTNFASLKTINTDDCQIIGCTFLDSEKYNYIPNYAAQAPQQWGSSIGLMGKRISMIECLVGQSSGEGIHAGYHGAFGGGDGYAHIQVEKLILRNNRIFDTWSAPIYVTNVDATELDPSIIEGNVIWHTNDPRYWFAGASGYPMYGIDIGSESGAQNIRGTNYFIGSRNLIIRNNIVSNASQILRFPDWPGQQTTNVKVLNNTLYRTIGGDGFSSVISNYEPTLSNITVRNNLCYDVVPARLSQSWLTPTGVWDHGTNLFSSAPPSALAGTGDIINNNPGLVSTTYQPTGVYPTVTPFDVSQLKIRPGSVAVNTGTVLNTDVPTDFFGNPRPTYSGKFDIGAHSLSKALNVSYTDSGLSSGTYYYRARYTDSAGGVSAWSAIVPISTT